MKKKYSVLCGAAVFLVGLVLAIATHSAAIPKDAGAGIKAAFAMGMILATGGLIGMILSLLSERKSADVRSLAMASIFAALCYVGCTYLKIPIPGSTSFFHFGNTFCVLGALFLGGFWGGMAGSVGMTISDMFNGYIDSAPRTFLLKLCIGVITGLVAHKVFHISQDKKNRRGSLPVAVVTSCAAGLAFNVVADPLLGYFYKMYIMGISQDLAASLAKIATLATAVNAVVAVIAATIFYLALRPALEHARLLPTV